MVLSVDSTGKLSYSHGDACVGLDSPAPVSFVSHAHLDHAQNLKKSGQLVCSAPTMDLIGARCNYSAKHTESVAGDTLKLSLADAGHVLGSRQLVIENDEEKFCYTADFNTVDSILFPGAKPVECDSLLVESTYGLPRFSFPSREETYADIASWTKAELAHGCVLLGGYALGKAQEIVKVLNERLGVTPIVSDDIAAVCEVYNRHKIKLDYIATSSPEGVKAFEGKFVAVLPQGKVNSSFAAALSKQYNRKFATAVATGWASNPSWGFDVDRAFCLSDHCDFSALVSYVEATGAKKVYANHGYSREFSKELRGRGIDATPIEDIKPARGQRTLTAFNRRA